MQKTVKIFFIVFLSTMGFLFAQKNDTINKVDPNGLKQGYWIKTDAATKAKKYEGKFVNDKPEGSFKHYYPTGKLKSITVYKDKGKQAVTKMFYENGQVKAEGKYIDEKKDSIWSFYDDKGKLKSKENYNENKKNGLTKTFYVSGKLADESNWVNDTLEGSSKEYFENGVLKLESNYVNGLLDGPYKIYFSNSVPSIVGKYSKSVKEGDWAEHNETGTIKVRFKYKGGRIVSEKRENGIFTDYYSNGIPKEETSYLGGVKNGEYKEFYNTGEWKKIFKKGEDGYPDEWTEKLIGQKVKREGFYNLGKLEGKVTYYKPDGSVEKTENYKNGVLVK